MQTATLEAKIPTDNRPKYDIEWGYNNGDSIIALACKNGVKFVRAKGNDFSKCEVTFGVTNRKHLYDHTCVCFDNARDNNAYSGTEQGSLIKWKSRTRTYKKNKRKHKKKEPIEDDEEEVKLVEGQINEDANILFQVFSDKPAYIKCINSLKFVDKKIVSGSSQMCIKIHDVHLKQLHEISTDYMVMAVDYFDKMLTFSTLSGTIYHIAFDLDQVTTKKNAFFENETPIEIMQSHFGKHQCGLGVYGEYVYTCAGDNQLFQTDYKEHKVKDIYDIVGQTKKILKQMKLGLGMKTSNLFSKNAKMIAEINIKQESGSDFGSDLAINRKLDHIAITYMKGQIAIKELNNLDDAVVVLEDAKDSCDCIEYSPDGELLAVASIDKNVYIYK